MEFGYTESICHDMIHHLVNDIVVMGARPLAVLDTAEKDTIKTLVKGIADACRENECSLVGGETSIQPLVIDAGVYILTSSIVGVAEKAKVVDGSAIQEGDAVLAIASNGLHTNGYSLVRLLMETMPQVKLDRIDGLTLLEQVMRPHTPYYRALKGLLGRGLILGMAHVTGGGIEGNLCRIIPAGMTAEVDLSSVRTLPVFQYIRRYGNISDVETLRTFNCGVGLVVVAPQQHKSTVMDHVARFYDCYEIGRVIEGDRRVQFVNRLVWK